LDEEKPQPLTFDVLPLSPDVRAAVDALGYVEPTPVQVAVFGPAAAGKSVVVQARTGTGKTAAFGMPLIDRIVARHLHKPQALVLTPTRELALQVTREIEALAKTRGTRVACIYGGASMGKQVDALAAGAQIVVGTPGRVLDHIRRGTFDTSHVKTLVLDEADEMLSMGFAKELHAIADSLPRDRQGMLFSATLPPDILRLAETRLRDPEFITLSGDAIGALEVRHFVYVVPSGDKRQALLRVIEVEDPESAIVFCNTKDETERLAELLQSRGYDAAWLNGDLEQNERERIMQRTREGKLRFLVATDVAARGIDISHLTHVINADLPETPEQYVHRTGRTGRAGKTGTAISLIGPKDVGNLYLLRLTYKIRPIEKQLPSATEVRTREEADLVTMFAEAYASRPVHPEDLSLARRLLTHASADAIIAGLLRDHLGARKEDPKAAAAEARRAKNPPAIEPPPPLPAVTAQPLPSARREARGEARAERPGRPVAASERPGRPPKKVSSYTSWEPPIEKDDDAPILPGFTVTGGASSETPDEPEPVTIPIRKAGPAPSPRGAPARSDAETEEPGFTRIFLNVGRRDGARAQDLQQLLTDHAGIARHDTGRIRIRDRVTFVSVRQDDLSKAILALGGRVIGGRTVIAEPAKSKQSA
jgi:ATP-dependent RNA helicase DeaD